MASGESLPLISNRPILTSKAPAHRVGAFFRVQSRGTICGVHLIFIRNGCNRSTTGNIFDPGDLTKRDLIETATKRELVMNSLITDDSEQIDRKTSRSICDAVGEHLQQTLRPESWRLSSYLQHLMDELRKRDSEDHVRRSN